MKNIKIVAVAVLMTAAMHASAQTMHVFNYCNTKDVSIGTIPDLKRMIEQSVAIAGALQYEFNYMEGSDEDCSKEKLMEDIEQLKCGKDDIVLFYYSGHGMRSDKDQSPFPQMCLKYEAYEQDKWVPVHTVVEKLSAKKARLTVVLTDCCNSIGDYVTMKSKSPKSKDGGSIDPKVVENIKKLFLESKGIVVATSSKAGQPSGGNLALGGLFSTVLFEFSFYNATVGALPATWADILNDVKRQIKEAGLTQEPYFEVQLTSTPGSAQPSHSPAPVASNATGSNGGTAVVSVDNDFAAAISPLLNSTLRRENRLNLAEDLSRKYFSRDAKVATVGRNGTTVVEYESAYDWLHRLASSKNIRSVSIISESKNAQGARNYIKVQEIRNN